MKTKICIIILLCFVFGRLKAQSDNSLVLELKVSKQFQGMLGNTVYNNSHASWDGILVYSGLRYNDVWSFGFRFNNFKARVIDSSHIFSPSTNLKNYGAEISRHFYLHNRVSLAPFLNFGSVYGKNQGKFEGTQVGIGGNVHYYFWRGLYLCTGAEYDYIWLNIKAHQDIENLYNHTSALQASVGLGARF